MEQLATTYPIPYISMAYGIGFVGIVGYALFIFIQRKKLTKLIEALKNDSRT